MRPLNSSLIARSPWVAASLCLLLALVTASLLGGLFGDLPGAWLLGLLLGAAAWLALLWLVSASLLPRVFVDDAAGRLRVRGREYPATALQGATRSVSANASAAYLTYRFTLDDGRRFRLLAAGRPFRGLSPEALDRLHRLVTASRIAEPEGFSADQQRASSALQANSRPVPVGRAAILADIDELLGRPAPATPAPGSRSSTGTPQWPVPAPPSADDIERMAAEDFDAAKVIQQHVGELFRARRVSGVISLIGCALLVVIVFSFALDEWFGIPGWSPQHPAAGTVAAAAFGLAGIGAVVWMFVADASVRRVRKLAEAHWEASDATARAQGLPAPYLAVDAEGARRVSSTVAFIALIVGVTGIVIAAAAIFTTDLWLLPPILLLVAASLIVWGIVSWRRARRDARTSAERIALRGGARLGIRSQT